MKKTMKIEMINKSIIITDTEPKIAKEVREWLMGDEQFYLLYRHGDFIFINKQLVQAVTLY